MSLASGTRLGPYEILGILGAGGMGEVYRASDTRLRREVAIKVLPEAFARDEERMKRFEREAQVLASLHHPNVALIYGVEEANGVRALVLELVDGPTLAERIASGPVPVEEALGIAHLVASPPRDLLQQERPDPGRPLRVERRGVHPREAATVAREVVQEVSGARVAAIRPAPRRPAFRARPARREPEGAKARHPHLQFLRRAAAHRARRTTMTWTCIAQG